MEHRPARRRRGAVLEDAIIQAVWDELAEVGYSRLTLTAVAVRAGTSKPVLYRRWPNRGRLVHAAIAHRHRTPFVVPDTGTLRGDLLAMLSALAVRGADVGADALWGLLAESVDDPELRSAVRADLVDDALIDDLETLVDRAVARGELLDRPRSRWRLAVPFALMRGEALANGSIDAAAIEAIVDEVALPLFRAG